jgi:alpha-L-rhamnosidase
MTTISNPKSEYRINPLGIDTPDPRLSWQMQTDRQGARQTAYRVLVASTQENLQDDSADYWDSARIDSDQSTHIVYAGKPLESRQRAYWKVQVWDETGTMSESAVAWFEMGLLQADDWQAEWIGTDVVGGVRSTIPVPHLRKAFLIPAEVASARLYVTALGVFECSINGQRVGEDVFAPGWTDYRKRIQVLTYDVTDRLQPGENVLGGLLGDGWAVGYLAWIGRQNYADRPQFLAQLEITLSDGSTQTIITDNTWHYRFGPVTHSDFIMGEAYDARRELPGWNGPGYDAVDWHAVTVFPAPTARLVALNGPTVKAVEELSPIDHPRDTSGMGRTRFLFDLGQNMVGRVRFKGTAPAGKTVIIRFAEVLNPDGSPYFANLRAAHATDYYTFIGEGEETWESSFTFHGFRYVEIEGYEGPVSRETITAVVLHSDMAVTGTFACSDPLLNQLQHNIQWGQKGNFLDVPTDCPQRDERLGWTGDIQVFASTAAFNMDIAGFMTKWLGDVTDAQGANGEIPAVVPYVTDVPADGGPAWADAAIICPWTIYTRYGDTRILEQNYATMTRFMDFMLDNSPGLIRCAPDFEGWPGFGDWLSVNASTPRDLIGTAFLAYDAHLMAQIADILARPEDAARYRQVFNATRTAFQNRYLAGSEAPVVEMVPSVIRRYMDQADTLSRGRLEAVDYGEITSAVFNTDLFTPTQTAYVLALYFDLLPEDLRAAAVDELIADIERRGNHLSTGFVGSPYIAHVLSENGQLDAAYALLNQQTWPSWLYAVTQGATTIWERWDGYTGDNGFQTPEMNSFNHYAYGAIGAWMYSTIAGINLDPSQPGYKHPVLRPQPGGGLTYARATLNTPYGELVSEWQMADGTFTYCVVVPPNTTATVTLPFAGEVDINGEAAQGHSHNLGAGRYEFVVRIQ